MSDRADRAHGCVRNCGAPLSQPEPSRRAAAVEQLRRPGSTPVGGANDAVGLAASRRQATTGESCDLADSEPRLRRAAAPSPRPASASDGSRARSSPRARRRDGVRQKRLEQSLEPEHRRVEQEARAADASAPKDVRVRTFESELDPFKVGLLDTGHSVMFRNVWRDGRRYIQGALIDRERFLSGAVRAVRFARAASRASAILTSRIKAARSASCAPRRAARTRPTSAELAGSAAATARGFRRRSAILSSIFGVNQLPRARRQPRARVGFRDARWPCSAAASFSCTASR